MCKESLGQSLYLVTELIAMNFVTESCTTFLDSAVIDYENKAKIFCQIRRKFEN